MRKTATPRNKIKMEATRVKDPFELVERLLPRSATASSMPRFKAKINPLYQQRVADRRATSGRAKAMRRIDELAVGGTIGSS